MTAAAQPTVLLNDGVTIPQLGLGVWKAAPDVVVDAVRAALQSGYRHIDTASAYRNEEGVGQAVRNSGLPRDDIFVTTKLWNDQQGFDSALRAFDASLGRLGLEQVDLYLIHWPAPRLDLYVETWKALIRLRDEGRVRAIGVSNFLPEHLERLIAETGVTPALNQVELHPRFQQRALREAHARLGVATQSWSPLGQGGLLNDPTIAAIAEKHGRTAAQVIIRWHLDSGLIVIPKSVTPSRIAQNFDVFAFTLDADDMARIAALDAPDGRIGPDPLNTPF